MALSTDAEAIFILARKLGSDDKLELAERLIADVRQQSDSNSVVNGEDERQGERPTSIDVNDPDFSFADLPMVGIWSDREDMADPVAYIRKLRRHEWGEP